ncbi:MAG: pentapeptide repeat-containing protein, partial [Treponemataceae bacterium]
VECIVKKTLVIEQYKAKKMAELFLGLSKFENIIIKTFEPSFLENFLIRTCTIKDIKLINITIGSFEITQETTIENGLFENISIEKKFELGEVTLQHTIFKNCKIKAWTQQRKPKTTPSKLANIKFDNTEFMDEANFSGEIFTNCRFYKSIFNSKAYFNNVKFKKHTSFSYTEFNTASFFKAQFSDNPTFENIILKPESHLYFGYVNSSDKETERKNKNLKAIEIIMIKNTIINGRLDFNNDNIEVLDLQGTVIAGSLSRVGFNAKCANYQTATILKNEELKINNLIKALEYKAEEKDLYNKHLKWSVNTFFDKTALWLSKVVNNHGQNWIRGVCFTLCVWILPFVLFYLPSPFTIQRSWLVKVCYAVQSGELFSKMFEFINPTNYEILSDYLQDLDVPVVIKIFGTLCYIFGKIFVPYGVYETIVAFKKYNKI